MLLVKVYDFLIWNTVVSVTMTLILWGLTFQKKFTPPPQMLTLVTNVINPFFCWTSNEGSTYLGFDGSQESGLPEGVKNIKDYSKDWNSVYLGINNILLILFSFIYVIGLIVCVV